jgi:DNA-binding transcriptional LysR family regulator
MRPFVAAEERAAVAEAADVVVGLRLKGGTDSNIVSRRLFSERFVCVVRPDHPALSKRWTPQTFTELGHAFVALRGTPGGAVDDALKRLGLERRIVVAVPHFLVAPFIVKDTDLVLTLPERMAHAFSRHVPLAILEPPFPLPGFTIEISWHQRVHLDPAHVWFREQVIAVAKEA